MKLSRTANRPGGKTARDKYRQSRGAEGLKKLRKHALNDGMNLAGKPCYSVSRRSSAVSSWTRQSGNFTPNALSSRAFESTEYTGRRAGVG